ncbi:MAG: DNA primase [Clostridiales bacterium]|nr:DNA primase [Clostridiales bacterium]
MAQMAGQEWFDELFSRINIEEIIGEVVPLTRKGQRLWACCPFHSEKTPSFSVDPTTGLYYCFGCHKGGNALTFLKDYEHIDGREAMEELAKRARMELPQMAPRTPQDDKDALLKEEIYKANVAAARFYHDTLWTDEGADALKYLYSRGLKDADIKHFGLGCAPASGKALYEKLKSEGFPDEVLLKGWLCGEKEGRFYDMFRDRVMFPIINSRDKVVGFGGRVMGKGEPKYLNTSDTPVFLKRNGVYGLNFAKGAGRLDALILVEGYMDTVMLLKQGIRGAVATLGTALTQEQIRLMKRFVKKVIISYDGDAAGQKAALRALDMFEPSGMDVSVIDYPENKDPDEFIKAYGREAWEKLPRYKPAKYRMIRAEDGLDITKQDDLTEYTIRCCSILKGVTNAVEYENYLRELSVKTGYSREVLQRQAGMAPTPQKEQTPRTRPQQTEKPASELEKAQMQLFALAGTGAVPAGVIRKEDFDDALLAQVYDEVSAGTPISDIIQTLDESQTEHVMRSLNSLPGELDREDTLKLANELMETIRKQRVSSRINALTARLAAATGSEKEQITKELNDLLLRF